MSAIAPDRPFFPPAAKGQGGGTAFNAAKALKEAQVAFFRPVAATVAAPETEAAAPAEPRPEIAAAPAPASAGFKRPGSYLDIRV